MASETSFPDQSSADTQRNSSSRGIPLFLPFIFGITAANPPQETQDQPSESRERVIFINALTQTMVVMEAGEKAKEMPCKHRFHGNCIERWLNISGSCPVCRYQMPEEEKYRDERERRGGIWLSVGFGGGPTSWDENRETSESSENHRETED